MTKKVQLILVKKITTNNEYIKKRATVEHNGMELVVALLFANANINIATDLIQRINDTDLYTKIQFNAVNDLTKYKEDILKKVCILNHYIDNFRKKMCFLEFAPENIKTIYIAGKKNKHPAIDTLNKFVDKKAAKSDIYIELHNNTIFGVSVKQSANAPLSNYSVQHLLDKETNRNLTEEKKRYLNENGFSGFDKTKRQNMNELFYSKNKTNPYWILLKEQISLHKQKIITQLVESLFCANLQYDVYEFNGVSFTKINQTIDLMNVSLEEHLPYYFTKAGEERETAKLFYKLVVNEKIFKIEIRWKGDIYRASPQFLIYHDD
jgi:hypothetical protein